MKATKIHEFSNGVIIAKLGTRNVCMIPNENYYTVWNLPPWDGPAPVSKEDVEWNV